MFPKNMKAFLIFIFYTIRFWFFFSTGTLLFTPFYTYRFILKHFIVPLLHPSWVQMLDCRDAMSYEELYESADDHEYKGLTSCFSIRTNFSMDGHFKLEDFIHKFQKCVFTARDSRGNLAYEKFTFYCETWGGYPFWKRDATFKLENHIRFTDDFGERRATEDEIEMFMGEHNLKPFQRKTSPWEIWVFKLNKNCEGGKVGDSAEAEGENGERDQFTIYCRFHHCLMDGFSMVKMFSLFNTSKIEEEIVTVRVKSDWRVKLKFLATFVVNIGHDIVKMIHSIDKNEWRVSESQLTSKLHMVTTETVDFEIARVGSKLHGVSTTALLFSALSGGIHNYLNSKDGANGAALPELMGACAAMPVPNHPLEGMVNYWTYVMFYLPIREKEPLKRMEIVAENLEIVKKSAFPLTLWAISPLYTCLPHFLVSLVRNRMTTLTCSNFRGPKNQNIYFGSYVGEGSSSYLPRMKGNAAVGVVMATYMDKINFTVCVDQALIPERSSVKKFGQCIVDELRNLATLQSVSNNY